MMFKMFATKTKPIAVPFGRMAALIRDYLQELGTICMVAKHRKQHLHGLKSMSKNVSEDLSYVKDMFLSICQRKVFSSS